MKVSGECLLCGACVGVCPKNCLFLHTRLTCDDDACSRCGLCVRFCPVGALEPEPEAAP